MSSVDYEVKRICSVYLFFFNNFEMIFLNSTLFKTFEHYGISLSSVRVIFATH